MVAAVAAAVVAMATVTTKSFFFLRQFFEKFVRERVACGQAMHRMFGEPGRFVLIGNQGAVHVDF